MVDMWFELAGFSSSRVNAEITTHHVEIGNKDGTSTYPDHENSSIAMWEYVLKDNAMGEHLHPVFKLKVYTMEHIRDKVCDGNVWPFTRGILPVRIPSSGTQNVPMVHHELREFLVVEVLTNLIQCNVAEWGISWDILDKPSVQPSHWWGVAVSRDPQ
jgi:hypothetical protein